MKFIDQIPWFALKMRILKVAPLMVISSSSVKPVLILSFDFGLIGSEPSLVGIGKLTFFPHTLLEVCPAHKTSRDQVHGLCWWENTNRTKTLFILL